MSQAEKTEDKPKARFIGGDAFRKVPLQFPVEFDGKSYDHVTVRRMTVAEMQAYIRKVQEEPDNQGLIETMLDCPPDLLDHLFPDDAEEVDKVVYDFLPRALKEDLEQSLQTGEDTPTSSPQSSDGDGTTS